MQQVARKVWASLIVALVSHTVAAQEMRTTPVAFAVEPQPLYQALNTWAKQAGVQLVWEDANEGEQLSPRVIGKFAPVEALRMLLNGSGLEYAVTEDGRTVEIRPVRQVGVKRTAWATSKNLPPSTSELQLAARGATSSSDLISEEKDAPAGSESKREPETLEEVVVTGSHIRGAEAAGSKLIVLDREQIQKSGYGRIQDVIASIPQNFKGASEEFNQPNGNVSGGSEIQLRGLGTGTTLTLVNGFRLPNGGSQGRFVDISSIPVAAIERIEILSDGASAIYGSDAIGGVVNVILRSDFEGAESRLRFGTAGGEADETQLSQVFGHRFGSVSALLGYEYFNREPVLQASREYTSRNGDFTRYGGNNWNALLRKYGHNPGTILDPMTGTAAFAIPSGQNGSNLQSGDLIAGTGNLTDDASSTDIFPQQKTNSAFLAAEYEISSVWTLKGTARYNKRETESRAGPQVVTVMVTPSNPFYVDAFGDGSPLFVAYDFARELGPATGLSDTNSYSGVMSLTGQLPAMWQLTVSGAYGREKSETDNRFIDATRTDTFSALDAALNDTNPQTALNVFGDGANNNPATIAGLVTSFRRLGDSKVTSGNITADGPVFSAPAGSVRLAVGVDYRIEELLFRQNTLHVKDDRDVKAAFAELSLPLLNPSQTSLGQRLDVSLAARYEDYSDFGTTLNPKLGISYQPLEAIVVRGTWGTSFRAPPFYQANPAFVGGTQVVGTFLPDVGGVSKALLIFGNNPDLHEEKAEIWTLGLDAAPWAERGPRMSLSYFNIRYEDKVEAPSVNLTLERQFASLIRRNPSAAEVSAICTAPGTQVFGDCNGIQVIVDSRNNNIAVLNEEGVDLNIAQTFSTKAGEWSYGVGGTYLFKYEKAVTDAAPAEDILDTANNPIDLRVRGVIGWKYNAWSAGATVNHSGGYRDPGFPGFIPPRRIDSFTTVDFNVGLDLGVHGWLSGSRLTLSAVNLFDELPPFVNNQIGYDGANATILGRMVSLQFIKDWGSR